MLVGTDVYVWWSSCGNKTECPEETHLSDLVTTWPSYMPTPGIKPGSQWWEASALTLRKPDGLNLNDWLMRYFCLNNENIHYMIDGIKYHWYVYTSNRDGPNCNQFLSIPCWVKQVLTYPLLDVTSTNLSLVECNQY